MKKGIEIIMENIEATGYSYRSYRIEDMAWAVLSGAKLFRLDTGSYGEDDLLLGDSTEEAVADVLSYLGADRLPEGWSIADITDIAASGVRDDFSRIGPQMGAATEFVSENPGCCKKFVAERITPCPIPCKNWAFGYEPINRAIKRGLISAEFSAGKYSLHVTPFGKRYLQSED